MRLVACSHCHAQYDVTEVSEAEFACHCGAMVRNQPLRGVDARILRCGSCGAALEENAEQCGYCGSPIVRDTRKLSLICPECLARNAEDTRFCTACGVVFKPQARKACDTGMPCPCCEATLAGNQVGGVGVGECPRCSGLWVPREHFDLLVGRAIASYRQRVSLGQTLPRARLNGANPRSQEVIYRKCPECGSMMARRNYARRSGVIIDRCPAHGTWLDADELEQIVGHIIASGSQPEPAGAPAMTAGTPAPAGKAGGGSALSQRSREIIERQRQQRERRKHRGRDAALSVLGFLGELLTTEIE